MKRTLALPSLAVALILALAAAVVVSLSASVPKASAYYLANGCDIYNEYNGVVYRCTPDRTTYYTPDGLNPNYVYPGTEGKAFADDLGGGLTIYDNIGIPPPAPFDYGRDYCSNPPGIPATFEGRWQVACYNHDVCYGSQKGRLHCDVKFWQDMVFACKGMWASNFIKEWCIGEADQWYTFVRVFGAGHYKPRLTSYEPRGN
jgi:hypothetical protein